ncbi:MAG: AAA family ATPase [Candidatus Desulfaltia sp.]|nr:AAA family ATPase [Candidatus Desulfaltia sp.]
MIFISGVHGVGKSYFCEEVKRRLGLNAYSASMLISELKKERFEKNKLIRDIDDNQDYLLSAIKRIRGSEKFYLLDGHFCLLNAQGQVQRIHLQTFLDLKP